MEVRLVAIRTGVKILKHQRDDTSIFKEICEHLTVELTDQEPRIREGVVEHLCNMVVKRRMGRTVPEKLCHGLIERIRDKKQSVRRLTINKLATVWHECFSAYCASELFDRVDLKWTGVVAELLSAARTIPSIEDQLLAEEVLDELV